MKIVKQSFAFFLVFVMLVCACPVSISAASTNGEITVGNASGYPGDIVGVNVSMTKLPSDKFAYGVFYFDFGDNLEYVNTVQASVNVDGDIFWRYGNLVPSNPYDAITGSVRLNYDNGASPNFDYARDMVTIYFRIKGSAKSTDDPAKTSITLSNTNTDVYNSSQDKVQFDGVSGFVQVLDRNTELGEELLGHSLTLDGNISLNFHVDTENILSSDPEAVVNIAVAAKDGDIKYSEKLADFKGDANEKVISCSLPAFLWNADVSIQIVGTDGKKSATYTYSVKNYAQYMLSGNFKYRTDSLTDLCVALLNYGSYAQACFGYEAAEFANHDVRGESSLALISELVTAAYDDDIKASAVGSFASEIDSGLVYNGANVAVDSASAIRHYFTLEGDISNYSFEVSYNDGELKSYPISPVLIDGEYTVTIENIPAAYLDLPYTLTVKEKNNSDKIMIITYNVRMYMASIIKSGSADADLKNLVRAMYLYSEAANAYFGK